MEKLHGKIALITGSDSGIGHAIAIEFAKNGADIVVCYHSDREGAEKTAAEIIKIGRRTCIIQVDVSVEQEVKSMFEKAADRFKEIDILVNSAAVNGSGLKIEDMPTEVFDRTIRTNLYGIFFTCREFINHLKAGKKKGKIVNISSVHEEVVAPGGGDYNASKAALKNLTRTLAVEVAEYGINVNNIAPGMILTPMNQSAIDDKKVRDEKSAHIPMKRPGDPEEVARVALFLASSDSDYVTGASYFIDGALSLSLGQGA